MKKVNLVLSCLSLLSIMTACKDPSGSGSEDGKTKISFFGWGSAEEQENFQILIDEFMKDNPDVLMAIFELYEGGFVKINCFK